MGLSLYRAEKPRGLGRIDGRQLDLIVGGWNEDYNISDHNLART